MNVLIGGADGYDWSQLRGWVLTSECFNGKRVLLTYRMDEETEKKCIAHGIEIVRVNNDIYGQPLNHHSRDHMGAPGTISHEMRYFHAWQYLSEQDDVRFVVLTDTRDVIFQRDPIEFLQGKLSEGTEKLLAPAEGILYRDEPWGTENLYRAYGGYVYEMMKDFPTYNCGTIAGVMPFFKDLLLVNYFLANGRTYPADQCSFAILLRTLLRDDTYFCHHNEGWACQVGVTADPSKIDAFRSKLITAEPIMKNDGFVETSNGKLFCIVHQYERNPRWLQLINKRLDEYETLDNHSV